VILLSAVCIYPPFVMMTEGGIIAGRKWDWIFTLLPTPYKVPEIDLVMVSIEATIAVLLALGILLVLLGIKKVLMHRGRSHRKVWKPVLKE